jgi:hypothetical protein
MVNLEYLNCFLLLTRQLINLVKQPIQWITYTEIGQSFLTIYNIKLIILFMQTDKIISSLDR